MNGRRGNSSGGFLFGIKHLTQTASTNSIAPQTGICYSPRTAGSSGGALMAFCKACGQDAGEASFCPKCGAAQGAAPSGGATSAVAAPAAVSPTAGIDENIAGLLCYIFWWISGLIFLLLDKRPFVRFHAAQDIAFNIAMAAVGIVFWIVVAFLTFVTALLHFPIGFLVAFLWPVVALAFLGIWIFLMYKAYNHEKFKLPIIGDMVEKMVGQ
ncbi:MAG TPA: DUF4870 domain-containing protein [Candidatus Acidoferrum sp.]|nr:DUF4870 domain-containing protein [Candidatus Acidoferrum sp.]